MVPGFPMLYIPPALLGVAVTRAPAPIPADRLGVDDGPCNLGVLGIEAFLFSSS